MIKFERPSSMSIDLLISVRSVSRTVEIAVLTSNFRYLHLVIPKQGTLHKAGWCISDAAGSLGNYRV